jgi:hypothetical protein
METATKKRGSKSPAFDPAPLFHVEKPCNLFFKMNGIPCRFECDVWSKSGEHVFYDFWIYQLDKDGNTEFMANCKVTPRGIYWRKYQTSFGKQFELRGHIPFSHITEIYSPIPDGKTKN